MLTADNLSFRYARRSPLVLNGAGFSLRAGEIGILLGKNGSGKTTLFRILLGMEKPQSGTVRFEGENLFAMSRRERAMRIAYVPQDVRFGALSVYDTVLAGRVARFGFRAGSEDRQAAERVLGEIGLLPLARRNAEKLSGGERQKVAIARALAQEPQLLIFDEPTGNLDIANEQLIADEAKRAARERGAGVLIALHDLNRALSLGDRFFLLKNGRIRTVERADDVTETDIRETFDAEARMIEAEGMKIIIGG